MDVAKMMMAFAKETNKRRKPPGGEEPWDLVTEFTKKEFAVGEIPSGNGAASARGLAKIASVMSRKGVGIMSEKTWEKMHGGDSVKLLYGPFDLNSNFTRGGVAKIQKELSAAATGGTRTGRLLNGLSDGYVGWWGLGGSVFMWHPELEIGFAFTCNNVVWVDLFNLRAAYMQEEIAKVARKLAETSAAM